MDTLEVRLTPHEERLLGQWTAVELLVNGRQLKQLVAEFEQSNRYEPAGGYDWISLHGLAHARDRLIGQPNSWPGDGRVVLLVCEGCREEGCWPLFGRIEIGPQIVVWDDLHQPHRPDRDYSGLRFSFDRQHYETALAGAFGAVTPPR